jgi:lipopolysaccharide assembly outer membrane protein LptD (OstA)
VKKKISIVFLLLTLLFTSTVFAAMPTIRADHQYFDITSGLQVLSGNVYIEHKNRVVTAGEARTNYVEVWASGGVTFTQDDIYFTGSTVYVSFPKNLAQISGGISFSRSGLQITANQVDFNWKTKVADFSGNVQVTQDGNSWSADTASYNVITNSFL